MPGYHWSVPSDAVARELERLGHKLVMISSIEYLPPANYDFVWSPYESVVELGDSIAQKLNIPHVAHIEWLPPWRCLESCDSRQYGIDKKTGQIELANHKDHLVNIGRAYKRATVRTIGGRGFIKYISDFCGGIGKMHIRYPSIDANTLNLCNRMYTPKRRPNTIITVARAVPNKRYDLMMKVIEKIDLPQIEWVIVGDGPMIDVIKKRFQDNKKVTVQCIGPAWGWARWYYTKMCMVSLNSWTGMPPIESALLGTYPFVIVPPKADELTTNSISDENFNDLIAKSESAEDIAKLMTAYLKDPSSVSCDPIIESFLNGEMGIQSSATNAKNLIELVKPLL